MFMTKLLILFFLISSGSSYIPFIKKMFPATCCEDLGECFDSQPPFVTLPRPDCPSGLRKLNYQLWNRKQGDTPTSFSFYSIPDGKYEFRKNSSSSAESLPMGGLYYFIVHGWMSTIKQEWLTKLKNELLKKDDANIIMVDWQNLASKRIYMESASNTWTAGAHVAKVINMIRASTGDKLYMWCMGHSLGAHVCGQAGMRSHINRITGLDPAGPYFRKQKQPKYGLNSKCADFVDVIHSDNFAGTFEPIGDADFYPDGGKVHPMCFHLNHKCNHGIAVDLFTASINHQCFKAQKCTTTGNFGSSCEKCTECAQMGYAASADLKGIFFLETKKEYPYCKLSY